MTKPLRRRTDPGRTYVRPRPSFIKGVLYRASPVGGILVGGIRVGTTDLMRSIGPTTFFEDLNVGGRGLPLILLHNRSPLSFRRLAGTDLLLSTVDPTTPSRLKLHAKYRPGGWNWRGHPDLLPEIDRSDHFFADCKVGEGVTDFFGGRGDL